MVIDITDENFETEVAACELPVLIDFYAEWCGPCKLIAPIVEEVAAMLDGRVKCGRVNTATEKGLRIKFAAATLPMLALYRDGTFVDLVDGVVPAQEIVGRIDRVLSGDIDPRLVRKPL